MKTSVRSTLLFLLLTSAAWGIRLNRITSNASDPGYTHDCWKKLPVSLSFMAVAGRNPKDPGYPGAGINKFKPFEVVLKDGFSKVACVKDQLFFHGDKFGDSRHDYTLGSRANVSIVHYAAHVPKEDRKAMTQKVCFEFCRTVPNMQFFGLLNGQECYCAPYYTMMAGDSSNCDATCEGDTTLMCGGKTKSSIFSMHMCASTEADLAQSNVQANAVGVDLHSRALLAEGLAEKMEDAAVENQKIFGKAGDPDASDLMQEAKVFAGELHHAVGAADKVKDALTRLVEASRRLKGFSDPDTVTKAERIMEAISKEAKASKKPLKTLGRLVALAKPSREELGAGKQYYPLMYYVDKKFQDTMQTCSGEKVNEPIVGESLDGCASACDATNIDCVGFSYFGVGETSLCFLFSSLRSATYYTGCGDDEHNQVDLLQKSVRRSPGVDIDPWKCGSIGSPLQAVNKEGKSYILALDIPTGDYKEVFEVKKAWKGQFTKINACSINPVDSIIYCVMQVQRGKNSVVRIDTKKVAFVATVEWSWAAAFDSAGTFYYGNGDGLFSMANIASLEGKESVYQVPKMGEMEAIVEKPMGADVAIIDADLEGSGKKTYAIGTLKEKVAIARVSGRESKRWILSAKGLPAGETTWGAAWNFKSELYYASNSGKGVYQLDLGSVNLEKKEITFVKAGKSMETNSNDGLGCPKGRSPFKPVLPPKPKSVVAPFKPKPPRDEVVKVEKDEVQVEKLNPPKEQEQKFAPKKGQVRCMVKLSKFEGINLKPDPSCKCKMCLKTLSRADRCY